MDDLDPLVTHLRQTHGVVSIIGVELEWMLLDADAVPASRSLCERYLGDLRGALGDHFIESYDLEDGAGQVEVALRATSDLAELLDQFELLKKKANYIASSHDLSCCFAPKPFPKDYGNGMHLHIHLEDGEGHSLCWKEEERLSPALRDMLGGMLHSMHDDLMLFAGSDTSLMRYVRDYHAPVNASWGYNNRTVALRLPDASGHARGLEALLASRTSNQSGRHYKRVEYRLASADASLASVLAAILRAIDHGLTHHPDPGEPIYGNAADAQYGLELFAL